MSITVSSLPSPHRSRCQTTHSQICTITKAHTSAKDVSIIITISCKQSARVLVLDERKDHGAFPRERPTSGRKRDGCDERREDEEA